MNKSQYWLFDPPRGGFPTCVTDPRTDGWMDGQTDGRTDGWTDVQILQDFVSSDNLSEIRCSSSHLAI